MTEVFQRVFVARKRALGGTILAAGLLLATSAGCVHDRPLRTEIARHAALPAEAAVLFFVDGLGNAQFDEHLRRGDLPNVNKYILQRGLRFRRTVTCLPSITYAATATFLTGVSPGRHGIVGNRWFDPHSLVLRDYTRIDTYRESTRDLQSPSIYELLHEQFTVSIQCATRPGVTRKIDNWATSGLNWFFGQILNVDKLIAMRFELIAELAAQTGRWPTFIMAYFPACDEIGHRYGTDSAQYGKAVRNMDEQIGRICRGLQAAGVWDRTLLVFVSDHGHVPIRSDGHFDMAKHLRSQYGLRTTDQRHASPYYEKRFAFYERYDAVVLYDGPRAVRIYLRGQGKHWYDRPADLRPMQLRGRGGGITAEKLAEQLVRLPAVRLVAMRAGPDAALLINKKGKALVQRGTPSASPRAHGRSRHGPTNTRITYKVLAGSDPLGAMRDARDDRAAQSAPAEMSLSAEEWLRRTMDGEDPGVISQVVPLFDSPRAGDMIVFAEPGWGFDRDDASGHGSTTAGEMRVPLIFAGPDVQPGLADQPVRIHSVMPTIVTALGLGERLRRISPLDGRVLRLTPDRAGVARGRVFVRCTQ